MNERIQALAEEAGVSIMGANENGVFTLLSDKQKKFAELIVRECAESMPQENLKQMLLKRFGVEE